jgi:hypothetical protein
VDSAVTFEDGSVWIVDNIRDGWPYDTNGLPTMSTLGREA